MNYLMHLWKRFQDLAAAQKLRLLVPFFMMTVLTIILICWALLPRYEVLFNHLNEEDAQQILSKLEAQHIPYKIPQDGKAILINKNLIAKTRLKLMSSSLKLSGTVGFELFDKNNFGMTDFSQKINYQRALQGELERTISSLEAIRQARVHLVLPDTRLFEKNQPRPKAAVTLHLKHPLGSKQIYGIQQLIRSSVQHLQTKHVLIVDQQGNTLSSHPEKNTLLHMQTKKNLEYYLKHKVREVLEKIIPKNQFIVTIDVSINYDERQHELIQPQNKSQVRHEKQIKHSSSDKTHKGKIQQELTLEKTYQLGSKKELFKQASGRIERISLGIVLPENTKKETRERIQRIVKNAVGFHQERGDTISVEALITLPKKSKIRPLFALSHTQTSIQESIEPLGIVLSCILFFLLSIVGLLAFYKARKKRKTLLLTELTQWLEEEEYEPD